MKKVILLVLASMIFLTGCGTKKEDNKKMVIDLSKATENVLAIKDSNGDNIFSAMGEITKDMLKEERFGINPDNIEEMTFQEPMINIRASEFAIVKPVAGKEDIVKKEMDAYFKKVEDRWSTYLPDQLELVKNRLVTKVGDYLVYVVSEDNDKVLEAIKAAEQK